MKVLAILLCGVIGVLSRYSIESLPIKGHYATFIVNMLGCIIAGFIYASDKFDQQWTVILLVGLCGGLTTFSGHVLQTLKLIENGHLIQSALYLIVPPLLGMLMLLVGVRAAKLFL